MIEVKLKECGKCFHLKALRNFGKLTSSSDGLKTQCKQCVSIYNKAYKYNIRALGNEPWQDKIGFLTV